MPQWFKSHGWLGILVVVLVALLVAAACGDDDETTATKTPGGTSPAATATPGKAEALAAIFFPESGRIALKEALEQKIITKFLFVDGTKSQKMFDDLGVANFEGMSGTAPGAADPTAGAKYDAAYQAKYPAVKVADLAFLREGYDAAYLIALAAVAANSNKSVDIRDNLRFVANPPGEKIGFGATEFKKAVDLLKAGKDIDYSGAAGSQDFDVNGDVANGAIETWKIVGGKITTQSTKQIDLAKETGVVVPTPAAAKKAATAPTDALKIGALMSLTGDLKDFGQPIADAIQMAADEINAAGGVNGQPVTVKVADDGTNPQTGQAAAKQLVDVDKVSAIIGALSSGVTLPVAESVTSPASILQISPASTSPALTKANDKDFLFRTTISDAAQGVVLAGLAKDLGFKVVCSMYVNTPYGQGLSEKLADAFKKLAGTVSQQVPIEQQATSYVSELKKCAGK